MYLTVIPRNQVIHKLGHNCGQHLRQQKLNIHIPKRQGQQQQHFCNKEYFQSDT